MPLVHTKKIEDTLTLYLWEITEPLSEILSDANLSSAEHEVFQKINNEKRKLEWCASRALLNHIFQQKV